MAGNRTLTAPLALEFIAQYEQILAVSIRSSFEPQQRIAPQIPRLSVSGALKPCNYLFYPGLLDVPMNGCMDDR